MRARDDGYMRGGGGADEKQCVITIGMASLHARISTRGRAD